MYTAKSGQACLFPNVILLMLHPAPKSELIHSSRSFSAELDGAALTQPPPIPGLLHLRAGEEQDRVGHRRDHVDAAGDEGAGQGEDQGRSGRIRRVMRQKSSVSANLYSSYNLGLVIDLFFTHRTRRESAVFVTSDSIWHVVIHFY